MRSQLLNLDFYKKWCQDIFGTWPYVSRVNNEYGGLNITEPKLIMTNGDEGNHLLMCRSMEMGKLSISLQILNLYQSDPLWQLRSLRWFKSTKLKRCSWSCRCSNIWDGQCQEMDQGALGFPAGLIYRNAYLVNALKSYINWIHL